MKQANNLHELVLSANKLHEDFCMSRPSGKTFVESRTSSHKAKQANYLQELVLSVNNFYETRCRSDQRSRLLSPSIVSEPLVDNLIAATLNFVRTISHQAEIYFATDPRYTEFLRGLKGDVVIFGIC